MNVIHLKESLPYRCRMCNKFIKIGEVHYSIKAYERQAYNDRDIYYENTISVIFICRVCAMGVNFSNLQPLTMFP